MLGVSGGMPFALIEQGGLDYQVEEITHGLLLSEVLAAHLLCLPEMSVSCALRVLVISFFCAEPKLHDGRRRPPAET